MSKRDRLLEMLRTAGNDGVTTRELVLGGVGSRYGARLLELRGLGFEVTAKLEDASIGCWRYTLISEPCTVSVELDASTVIATSGVEKGDNGLAPASCVGTLVAPSQASLFDASVV